MDWDDPAARAALIDRVGPDEYHRQQREWWDRSTVETVNGYPIRTVGSRFGRLFAIVENGVAATAYQTLEGAREHANGLPPAKP
jgi:hypothetical protein